MIKTQLMTRYKTKFGGSYVKEDGRWFWVKGKERHLVTTNWLITELKKPRKAKFHKNMEPAPTPVPEPTPEPEPVVEETVTEKPVVEFKDEEGLNG